MWPDDDDYIAELDGVTSDDDWEKWMLEQELRALNESRAQPSGEG